MRDRARAGGEEPKEEFFEFYERFKKEYIEEEKWDRIMAEIIAEGEEAREEFKERFKKSFLENTPKICNDELKDKLTTILG